MVHAKFGYQWGNLKKCCPPMSQIRPLEDTPPEKQIFEVYLYLVMEK